MKTLLFLLLFFIFPCCTMLAQLKKTVDNFTLHGTLTGKKIKVIWLRYKDYHNQDIQLSAPVKNGRFLFSGFIKSPAQAEFSNRYRAKSPFNGYLSDMFLSPGDMTVLLSSDSLFTFNLKGSVMQDDWMTLKTQEEPLMKNKIQLRGEMSNVTKAAVSQKSRDAMALLSVKADRYEAQEKQMEYRFIQTHPNSYVSPFLMDSYLVMRKLPIDSAETFYNSFTPAVKNSVAGTSVHNLIVYRRS